MSEDKQTGIYIGDFYPNFNIKDAYLLSHKVLPGDTLYMQAIIENTGTEQGTDTVEFKLGGVKVATRQFTLDVGEQVTTQQQVTYSSLKSLVGTGENTLLATVPGYDTFKDGSVTISDAGEVKITDYSVTSPNPETIKADYTVSKTSYGSGTMVVTVTIGDLDTYKYYHYMAKGDKISGSNTYSIDVPVGNPKDIKVCISASPSGSPTI